VGSLNKWEPGDGEVYSTCSIPKGEHCQALWHALHSFAPHPQSSCPFAPTCCPNKLPFPFGFVPPHTSTTMISYQENASPYCFERKHDERHASSKPK
jgi:hypothetical protein